MELQRINIHDCISSRTYAHQRVRQMPCQYHGKFLPGLLLLVTLLIARTLHAEAVAECDIGAMEGRLSSGLVGYEKLTVKLVGESTEGGTVDYYYHERNLKAVKAVVYGEVGKTEIDYYFGSTYADYASRFNEFYYSSPIYIKGSRTVARNQSEFFVCSGKLLRGIGDDVVRTHFERANSILTKVLELSPKI